MDADRILGSDVFDRDGRHLGRAHAVWRDPATDRAEFVAVHRGLTADRVVPVSNARWDEERRAIVVAYPEESIFAAPSVSTGGDIGDDEEMRLREHYGLARPRPHRAVDSARAEHARTPARERFTRASEDQLRVRQVLHIERTPDATARVERAAVIEDEVVIPLDDPEPRK